jgi:para-nitrobenzyl esterase
MSQRSIAIRPTSHGPVSGLTTDDLHIFRGIPYAAPPTERLRWQPPQSPQPWTDVRDCTEFSARAPQVVPAELVPQGGSIHTDADSPLSEDCLYLNVCAPTATTEEPTGLPVLVWIHGGGFHFGSGPTLIGDGAELARRGVVVVTFNYRLGALGFLDLSGLDARYEHSGNCGLLDQIAALRWVRDNISVFGGDPNRVTVAGVSAGAKSAINLMASPRATGLFQAAISQSGGDHVIDRVGAAQLRDQFLRELGLDGPRSEDLTALTTQDILAAQQRIATGPRATWVWRAVVDGDVLPTTPTEALRAGAGKGIPLIAGTVLHEANGYDLADPTGADQTDRVLEEIFGDRVGDVVASYRAAHPDLSDRDIKRGIMTDERYAVPTRNLLDAHSAHAPTWAYRFQASTTDGPAEVQALHGADCPLAWHVGLDNYDTRIQDLAHGIQDTWVALATTGKPTSGHLPHWPEYDADRRSTLVLDVPVRIVDATDYQPHQLWNDVQWRPGTWWPH